MEVGPRDGLQNEGSAPPSTDQKITLIQMLVNAGCQHIEVGSFVSPTKVPSMADSGQVLDRLREWRRSQHPPPTNVQFSCLVPNRQGLQAALQHHVDEIAIFGSASEAFSQRNIGCSIDESMNRFRAVVSEAATQASPTLPVRGYVSCVIACPYQGTVSPLQVTTVTEQMMELGCYEISLGDTIGVGTPASIVAMLHEVQAVVAGSSVQLAMHCHDTYGQALANIFVALERGIHVIDSSVAGLGGCPYAKGATGNVATEDIVYMLNGLGVHTGIDLEKLVDAAEYISGVLKRPSRSRAGTAIAAKRKDAK